MSQTRILAIAPYEGLAQILIDLASETNSNAALTVFVGDLQKGLDIALNQNIKDYDVVLSRGGTARLLEANLPLPVVNIAPTVLDILRLVRMARNMTDSYAIVAYPDIAEIAIKLFDLIGHKEIVCEIHSKEEAQKTIERLKTDGYGVIIGDAISVSIAKQNNINAILITSGKESAQAAISEAIRLHSLICRQQDQNRLLRYALDVAPSFIAAMDTNRNLLYSNLSTSSNEQNFLINEILSASEEMEGNSLQRTIRIESGFWDLYGKKNPENGITVFFLSRRNRFLPDRKNAIEIVSVKDAFHDDTPDLIGEMKIIHEQTEKAAQRGLPIYLAGKDGTPVDDILHTIINAYLGARNTCWVIHCDKLDDTIIKRVIESEDSPLTDNDRIVIFINIHSFPENLCQEYFNFVENTRLHRRCRVIYTSNTEVTRPWRCFLESCCCWQIPLLRNRPNDILSLANLYISESNYKLGKQIIGINSEVEAALLEYDWPGNNEQLRNVIRQAVISANADIITKADIQPALLASNIAESEISLPLHGTLAEMEQHLIGTVLAEENGNRIRTAERLGISRSTLWRILKQIE